MAPRRQRALALALALAALAWVFALIVPSVASAHEFRPAQLRVVELGEGAQAGSFELRLVSPPRSIEGVVEPGALQPRVPESCALRQEGPADAGRFRVECGPEGWVGPLGVDGLERHPVDVIVDLRYADGTRVTAVLGPAEPSLDVGGSQTEQPSNAAVFAPYLRIGVEHILGGFDHLLFVLGLVLLVADRKALLWTVTAFTLAHSVTLAASTLALVRLPGPPVEAVIALSIVLLARELVLGHADDPDTRAAAREGLSWRQPWLVALVFGLLHGFGFAGALASVGVPEGAQAWALLAFNLGVELGQLAVVALLLALFAGLKHLATTQGWTEATKSRAARAPAWAMGTLAFAWTLERVLGFLT